MKICDFTEPELAKFRKECNFTDTERQCFDLKAKDCTNVELSVKLCISESTVSVIMRKVRSKITKVMNWRD